MRHAVLLLAAIICSACTGLSAARTGITKLPEGSFATAADQRAVLRVMRGKGTQEKLVTCAEPSPDIAKLISETRSSQASLGASLPSGISAQAAYSFSRGYAEGMAQLTERLATIQILRDANYRACEAYANGAIDEVGYSLILANSGELMLALMTGELLAGRKPTTLASASAETDATSTLAARADAVRLDLNQVNQTLKPLEKSLKGKLDKVIPGNGSEALGALPPGVRERLQARDLPLFDKVLGLQRQADVLQDQIEGAG